MSLTDVTCHIQMVKLHNGPSKFDSLLEFTDSPALSEIELLCKISSRLLQNMNILLLSHKLFFREKVAFQRVDFQEINFCSITFKNISIHSQD